MNDTHGLSGEGETLSIREASQAFGVSDKTIRRWIKEGRLPATQETGPYGVTWRIPISVIQTAQQVIDVLPVERSIDPRTLGLIIAQAAAEKTQKLTDEITDLKSAVAQLTQPLTRLEEQRQTHEQHRDERIVAMMREAMQQRGAMSSSPRRRWPWQRR